MGDDLSGFRWHTGATLRPVGDGEACPALFRDVGPAALALFLRGTLPRLAGPLSPIVYTRTAQYAEPYTDYEKTGRLVILRPRGETTYKYQLGSSVMTPVVDNNYSSMEAISFYQGASYLYEHGLYKALTPEEFARYSKAGQEKLPAKTVAVEP